MNQQQRRFVLERANEILRDKERRALDQAPSTKELYDRGFLTLRSAEEIAENLNDPYVPRGIISKVFVSTWDEEAWKADVAQQRKENKEYNDMLRTKFGEFREQVMLADSPDALAMLEELRKL